MDQGHQEKCGDAQQASLRRCRNPVFAKLAIRTIKEVESSHEKSACHDLVVLPASNAGSFFLLYRQLHRALGAGLCRLRRHPHVATAYDLFLRPQLRDGHCFSVKGVNRTTGACPAPLFQRDAVVAERAEQILKVAFGENVRNPLFRFRRFQKVG